MKTTTDFIRKNVLSSMYIGLTLCQALFDEKLTVSI
jgi:hypothetical protein